MSRTREQLAAHQVATATPRETPVPLPPGLPKARPRSLLCMLCGFRTLDRDTFMTHCREVHP